MAESNDFIQRYMGHIQSESENKSKNDDLEQAMFKTLENSSNTKEEQIHILSREYTKLYRSHKELQEQFDEQLTLTDEISTNFTNLEERLMLKLKENTSLTEQLQRSSERLTKSLERTRDLEKELKEVHDARRKESVTEMSSLRLRSECSIENAESLKIKLKEMENEKHYLFLKIDELQSRLKIFEKDGDVPKNKESMCRIHGHHKNENTAALETQLSRKISENFQLSKELETAIANNKSLIDEKNQFNLKLDDINREKQDLKNVIATLETQLKKEQESLTNTTLKLQIEIEKVLHEKLELYQQIEDLEAGIETLQSTKEEEISSLKTSLKQTYMMERGSILSDNGRLKEKLALLCKDFDRLGEEFYGVKKNLHGLIENVERRSNRIKDMTKGSNPMFRNRLESDLLLSVVKELQDIKICVSTNNSQK